jgi:hypothetical protein
VTRTLKGVAEMPLVDITIMPGYRIQLVKMRDKVFAAAEITHKLVCCHFARALPDILVKNARILKLDPRTPPEGIQVQSHEFGKFDVNVPNVWIKVQLSENQPDEIECFRIRDELYRILVEWFTDQDYTPEDFVLDLLWGPTNGKGVVKGVEIMW